MALTATYDPILSRVRLAADTLGVSAAYAVFDRSIDGGVTWTTLRGGGDVTVATQLADLDDYEFPAGVPATYRVRSYSATDVLQATFTTAATFDVTGVWVKVVARPFLNTAVIVGAVRDVERPARSGVFDVVGRSYPVGVSDVRGSRRYTLEILTETAAEARDFDLLLASGEPIFVHVPGAESKVPGGYFVVGDSTTVPTGRLSDRRVFSLPLIEVAAPGPDVFGAAGSWQTVLDNYATWTAVMAGEPTWADVLELIGTPGEVIVP